MPENAVPDFSLPGTSGTTFQLSQASSKYVVVYFYPKDNTPGCTTEGQEFRDLHDAFVKADCEIYGVSRDNLKSHENFKAKMGFPFELLSDENEEVCKLFDVIKMKNMYGKQVRGVERSTFLLDRKGAIVHEWRAVKAAGHAQSVLDYVKAL